MESRKEIAKRLKEWGVGKFGDLTRFADALGMSPANLSQYVNGKSEPGAKIQKRLRELGCDVDFILTGKSSYGGPGKSGKVADSVLAFHAPAGMSKEKAAQIQKMINELAQLPEGDVERARDVVRAAFKKKK